MSAPIIEVQGVSKRYKLGTIGATSLRDQAERWWQQVRGSAPAASTSEFWALRDVSFTVRPGEVVGVIGRNGAGKSTLLKTLSRITEPTSGRIVMHGRVASLLEVGTGFHPELSGRDNIFLNGAILGMTRAEVRRKFDEIVAFSEVDKFIDTPVKRYSSGMYVRLAFAVAAHLEPEILIVDEVLAVGDAQFQKKCLGKMQDVARNEGRTVLFVSHNMVAVRALTQRCVYLQAGRMRLTGPTSEVLAAYTEDARTGESTTSPGGRHSRVLRASMINAQGQPIVAHEGQQPTLLEIDLETDGSPDLILECFLQDGVGQKLAICSPGHFVGWRVPPEAGRWRVVMALHIPPLASGVYFFDVVTTHLSEGFDHYFAEAATCEVYALTMRPAQWEYRRDYNAGYFIMDGDELPLTRKLG